MSGGGFVGRFIGFLMNFGVEDLEGSARSHVEISLNLELITFSSPLDPCILGQYQMVLHVGSWMICPGRRQIMHFSSSQNPCIQSGQQLQPAPRMHV